MVYLATLGKTEQYTPLEPHLPGPFVDKVSFNYVYIMVNEALPPFLNGPNGCQTRLRQPGPLTADTFAQLLRGEARPNSQRYKPRCAHPPTSCSFYGCPRFDREGPPSAFRLAPDHVIYYNVQRCRGRLQDMGEKRFGGYWPIISLQCCIGGEVGLSGVFLDFLSIS